MVQPASRRIVTEDELNSVEANLQDQIDEIVAPGGGWQYIPINSPHTGQAAWKKVDGTVHFWATFTSSLSADEAIQVLTLPSGTRPDVRHPVSASGSDMRAVSGYVDTNGIVRIRVGAVATVPYLYGIWDAA